MAANMNASEMSEMGSLSRSRYVPRQLVTAADLTTDQIYQRDLWRLHNRFVLGCGVLCGLDVVPGSTEGPFTVRVTPGEALSPQGDLIIMPKSMVIPLTAWYKDSVYLAVRYLDDPGCPISPLPNRCPPALPLEASRFQASFEFACLEELPPNPPLPALDCEQIVNEAIYGQRTPPTTLDDLPPLFDCPPETDDPWVVLARLDFDPTTGQLQIDPSVRSQLLPLWLLPEILQCLSFIPYPSSYPHLPSSWMSMMSSDVRISHDMGIGGDLL